MCISYVLFDTSKKIVIYKYVFVSKKKNKPPENSINRSFNNFPGQTRTIIFGMSFGFILVSINFHKVFFFCLHKAVG